MDRFASSVERVQRISSVLDHLHVNSTPRMPPRMLAGMMLPHALSQCVSVGGVRIRDTQEETARGISLQRGQKPLVE